MATGRRWKIEYSAFFAIFLWLVTPVGAETTTSDYNMFKRSTSPAYLWGENGVITVPKAQPVGKYNLYLAGYGQEAGSIQGENLYYTRATLMVGTSDDVEFGYTRAQLLWENGDRSDVEADVFSIKARVLNLGKKWLPNVAIGTQAVSLQENQFNSGKDILFNPYITATLSIPLFTDKAILSGTVDSEWLYSNGQQTKSFMNYGIDLALFDNMLILAAEQQGANDDDLEPVFNVAAKVKLFDVLNLGVGQYNLNKENDQDAYIVGFAAISLPIGDWSRSDKNEQSTETTTPE